jgi:hypothetical protein
MGPSRCLCQRSLEFTLAAERPEMASFALLGSLGTGWKSSCLSMGATILKEEVAADLRSNATAKISGA